MNRRSVFKIAATCALVCVTARAADVDAAGGSKAGSPTMLERLEQKVTLVFAKDSLATAVGMLSEHVGVPIRINDKDLFLQGLTKNQSLTLDERGVPASQALKSVLAKVSRDELVYVLRSQDENEWIEVTTRTAAESRGDALPAAFAAEKHKVGEQDLPLWSPEGQDPFRGIPLRQSYSSELKCQTLEFRLQSQKTAAVPIQAFTAEQQAAFRECLQASKQAAARAETEERALALRIAAEKRAQQGDVGRGETGPVAHRQAANGFRDMGWGDSPTPDMTFVGLADSGGEAYQRKEDNLRFEKNEASQIRYLFRDDRLYSVMVTFKQQQNLLDYLRRQYGKPSSFDSPKGNGGAATWKLGHTSVFFMGPLEGAAILTFIKSKD